MKFLHLSCFSFLFLSFFLTIQLHALVDAISVSGNPSTLVINTATAGSQPVPVVDATTTCTVETGLSTRRITGAINSNMPKNVTLQVSIQAPLGATSLGFVMLSTTTTNLLLGINAVLTATVTISYRLTTNVSAAQASASRTVTFTITA